MLVKFLYILLIILQDTKSVSNGDSDKIKFGEDTCVHPNSRKYKEEITIKFHKLQKFVYLPWDHLKDRNGKDFNDRFCDPMIEHEHWESPFNVTFTTDLIRGS
uniref:Uncharacterized protein n=1 Tax=Strongyloides venezuelensis TaxID=75913 RepID=A0A0K0FI52_STRVS